MPGAEEPENLSHDVCFLGYDGYTVADGAGISSMVRYRGLVEDRLGTEVVCSPSRRVPLQELTIEAALGRLAKIIEIQFIDQTLHSDTDLRRLVACVQTVRYRYDANSEEFEALNDGVGIADVARKPGQLVYSNSVERG